MAAAPAAIAVAAWLVLLDRVYLNNDAAWSLLWGRDLSAHGTLPDHALPGSPTPHPLATLVSAILTIPGEAAGYAAILAVSLISFAVLVWGVAEIGRVCFGTGAGVIAGIAVAVSIAILGRAAASFQDVPFAALVVLAALVEVWRPRAGVPVLVLLALAGLIRPEAWLFSGLYWLWLVRGAPVGTAARLALLAAAGPLLWALSDLVTTGEPLFSFTGTRDAAREIGRVTGLGHVPGQGLANLREIYPPPVIAGGLAGSALVLWKLRERGRVPVAVMLVGAVAFAVLGAAGLPLLERYLFVPAAMLAVLCGAAALGWWALPEDDPARGPWRIGGIVLIVGLVAWMPVQAGRLSDLRADLAERAGARQGLRTLADDVRPPLERCAPVVVPNHRPQAVLAYWLDREPGEFEIVARALPRGAFVEATGQEAADFVGEGSKSELPVVPAGFRPAGQAGGWRVLTRGC